MSLLNYLFSKLQSPNRTAFPCKEGVEPSDHFVSPHLHFGQLHHILKVIAA